MIARKICLQLNCCGVFSPKFSVFGNSMDADLKEFDSLLSIFFPYKTFPDSTKNIEYTGCYENKISGFLIKHLLCIEHLQDVNN